MSFFYKTPDYAGTSIKAEKQRQALITQGTADVNAVFSGGTVPSYQAPTAFTKGQQYYKQNKLGGYEPFTQTIRKQGYANRMKKGAIFEKGPDTSYTGFQPEFYNQIAKNYVNYAIPQLAQQYRTTQNAMDFGFANRGLSQSSVQRKGASDLNVELGKAEQGIADQGIAQAQDTQKAVEQARQNAINQLYVVGSPAQALQNSVFSAAQFQIPSSFAPLANAFGNIANQYATSQLYNPPTQPSYQNSYSNWMSQPIFAK